MSPKGKHPVLSAVACAGTSLCVAVDVEGGILSSTHPTRTGSWRRVEADPGRVLTGVSCPSTRLCVVVDTNGDLGNPLISVDPTGGAGAWRRSPFQGDLRAISCPSVHLCVAAEYEGSLDASTDPARGVWRNVRDGNPMGEGSVACASSSLCVAGDFYGGLATSTRPATRRWRFSTVFPWTDPLGREVGLSGASCPSNRMCVVIYAANLPHGAGPSAALLSRRPTDPGSWYRTNIDAARVNAISCPSTSVCVAVDARGRAVVAAGR